MRLAVSRGRDSLWRLNVRQTFRRRFVVATVSAVLLIVAALSCLSVFYFRDSEIRTDTNKLRTRSTEDLQPPTKTPSRPSVLLPEGQARGRLAALTSSRRFKIAALVGGVMATVAAVLAVVLWLTVFAKQPPSAELDRASKVSVITPTPASHSMLGYILGGVLGLLTAVAIVAGSVALYRRRVSAGIMKLEDGDVAVEGRLDVGGFNYHGKNIFDALPYEDKVRCLRPMLVKVFETLGTKRFKRQMDTSQLIHREEKDIVRIRPGNRLSEVHPSAFNYFMITQAGERGGVWFRTIDPTAYIRKTLTDAAKCNNDDERGRMINDMYVTADTILEDHMDPEKPPLCLIGLIGPLLVTS